MNEPLCPASGWRKSSWPTREPVTTKDRFSVRLHQFGKVDFTVHMVVHFGLGVLGRLEPVKAHECAGEFGCRSALVALCLCEASGRRGVFTQSMIPSTAVIVAARN